MRLSRSRLSLANKTYAPEYAQCSATCRKHASSLVFVTAPGPFKFLNLNFHWQRLMVALLLVADTGTHWHLFKIDSEWQTRTGVCHRDGAACAAFSCSSLKARITICSKLRVNVFYLDSELHAFDGPERSIRN